MIIKKIILENIKSYKYQEINLHQGINCILGLNGSGKTTIIESIGLALFNYTKGNINSLLRYNEKKGIIIVHFIANDDREYFVERIIRPRGNSVRIFDAASNTELYAGVSDVYSFIKKILKVKKTKEFSQMFAEIIAVPQGQFVSAFLETPTIRKENFDRLFNLHIYKTLGFKTKDLYNKIENEKVSILKEEIAKIDGEVSSYDGKRDKLQQLENLIANSEEALHNLQQSYQDLKQKRKQYDQLKTKITDYQSQEVLTKEKINNLTEKIVLASENLNEAQKALEIVNSNADGYQKYIENIEKLQTLEKKYLLYLDIEKKIKNFENEVKILITKKNNLHENIQEKIQEIESKEKEIQKLNSELVLLNNRYTNTNKEYTLLEQKVTTENETYINEKKEINQKYQDLQIAKAKLKQISLLDNNKLLEIKNEFQILEEEKKQFHNIKNQILKLEKEKAVIEANINEAIKNSQISEDGNCPFLKTKCKNIEEKSLIDYFNNLILELNNQSNQIDKELTQLLEEIEKEAEIDTKIASYEKLIADQKTNLNLITEIEESLEFSIEMQKESIYDKIDIYQKDLEQKLQDLELKEKQIDDNRNLLFSLRTKVDTLKFTIESKNQLYQQYEKEIIAIKNYLREQNEKVKEFDLKINNLNDAIKTKTKVLQENDVKEKIDLLKKENETLEESKNQYLSNLNKAKEKDKYFQSLKESTAQKQALWKKLQEISDILNNLQANYSEEGHGLIIERENSLIKEISSLETSINEKKVQIQELQTEIKRMKKLFIEKEEKQLQLEKYYRIIEFLKRTRTIYSSLPEKLSLRYREYISHAATQIYRKIAGENIILEMTEDYEVRLIDDEKNYKTIDQLSGGEQMTCALAIRLSMLKHFAGLDIYFLDEPTINLDIQRREKLADIILDVTTELSQLFVISHDDTFDNISDSIIKLQKVNNITNVL